jgi:hypothetical protein
VLGSIPEATVPFRLEIHYSIAVALSEVRLGTYSALNAAAALWTSLQSGISLVLVHNLIYLIPIYLAVVSVDIAHPVPGTGLAQTWMIHRNIHLAFVACLIYLQQMGLFHSAMTASGSPEFGSLARFFELGFFSPHSYHCCFQHMPAQEFYCQRCFQHMLAQEFCCPRFFSRRCPRIRM